MLTLLARCNWVQQFPSFPLFQQTWFWKYFPIHVMKWGGKVHTGSQIIFSSYFKLWCVLFKVKWQKAVISKWVNYFLISLPINTIICSIRLICGCRTQEPNPSPMEALTFPHSFSVTPTKPTAGLGGLLKPNGLRGGKRRRVCLCVPQYYKPLPCKLHLLLQVMPPREETSMDVID